MKPMGTRAMERHMDRVIEWKQDVYERDGRTEAKKRNENEREKEKRQITLSESI